MTPEEPNLPADGNSPVMVTEEYLIHIVKALNNLIVPWKMKTKGGMVKLQFAVQIGSKLDREKQLNFMEFTDDTVEKMKAYLDLVQGHVKLLTIAPEQEGACRSYGCDGAYAFTHSA